MRRRVRIIAMFLLLGAIVNVAVAWGLALWLPAVKIKPGTWRELKNEEALNWWNSIADQNWPEATNISGVVEFGTGQRGITVIGNPRSTYPEISLMCVGWNQHGWPLQALRQYQLITIAGTEPQSRVRWAIQLREPQRADRLTPGRVLPLQPVWPGFAINTILYAAILWGLFAMPRVLRRKCRMWRGLCPACAYQIGTSPVCTECGHALHCKSK